VSEQARRTYRIAIIPGDGIGPEVTAEAIKVLEACVSAGGGFAIDGEVLDLGAERYLRTGEVLPEEMLGHLREFDAVFLGAVGDPRVPPGVLEGGLLLALRQSLDLYVNLRPAKRFPGVLPGKVGSSAEPLDLVIVRENTEGPYCRQGQVADVNTDKEIATEFSINTAPAVERIVRYAFQLAQAQKRKLTLVHKTNVLQRAGSLYLRMFESLSNEYPGVSTEYQHVDAAALLLASQPDRFSAIVTDNLFGDILSDLTAALAGGIGLVGSGNIHPGKVSIFEPVHGSAPDIAGTGKANPIGAILSAALMLRHLGEADSAATIEAAVEQMAGQIATNHFPCKEAGDMIAEAVA